MENNRPRFNPRGIVPEQRRKEMGWSSTWRVRRAAIDMDHSGYAEKCPVTNGNPLAY